MDSFEKLLCQYSFKNTVLLVAEILSYLYFASMTLIPKSMITSLAFQPKSP